MRVCVCARTRAQKTTFQSQISQLETSHTQCVNSQSFISFSAVDFFCVQTSNNDKKKKKQKQKNMETWSKSCFHISIRTGFNRVSDRDKREGDRERWRVYLAPTASVLYAQ